MLSRGGGDGPDWPGDRLEAYPTSRSSETRLNPKLRIYPKPCFLDLSGLSHLRRMLRNSVQVISRLLITIKKWGASMGKWSLSRRDRLIVARHEVPGSGVWTFAESPDLA